MYIQRFSLQPSDAFSAERGSAFLKKVSKKYIFLLTFVGYFTIIDEQVAVNASVMWNLSSAGRASALQAEGHRFEPYRFHSKYGEIAQLARAYGSYP